MSKQGTDLDLLRQLQIYEAVLHHEDGDEKGTPLRQLDDTIRYFLIRIIHFILFDNNLFLSIMSRT